MLRLVSACALALALVTACAPSEKAAAPAAGEKPFVQGETEIAVGRHLVIVGGCNDCHTAGYAETGGNIPESEWLKGKPVGNYGPWGTTYAANLRLTAASMTADEWVEFLQTNQAGRPIMPWNILREYNPRDLRAIHAYIRTLGEPGEPMPAGLPPGPPPNGPYVDFLTHAGPPPGAAKQ